MFTSYLLICIFMLILLGFFSYKMTSNIVWVTIIPLVVFSIFGIFSSLYLETGIYVFEQDRITEFTGSTLRLILLFFWFWLIFGLTNKLTNKQTACFVRSIQIKKSHLDLALLTSATLLLTCLVNIYISGDIPFFKPGYINRFEYLQNTKLWWLIKIFGVSTTLVPLLLGIAFAGYSQLSSKPMKYLCIVVIIFYLIYIILLGNKFGGIVYGLYYFFIPLLIIKIITGSNNKKLIINLFIYGTALSIPVFALVYYHYSTYPLAEEYGGPLAFIMYRIFALQGHLWWGIDHHVFIEGSSHILNINEMQHSMPTMMRVVSGNWIETAIERGVSFTFGFPASPLLFFGPGVGLIVIGLIAATIAFIARLIVASIANFDTVQYVLSAYIMIWLANIASMGSLEVFIQPKFLLITLALAIYLLMKSSIGVGRSSRPYRKISTKSGLDI